MKKGLFIVLIAGLFLFRLFYGLGSEFWLEDEKQIYLIGLKSFTTHTWPYYGPDIVYTSSQIPGALQGLLISIPLTLLPIPESPIIFLNILSFIALAFFAFYITKRFPGFPKWLVWVFILTTPWIMRFGPRVVNPSYVLPFSILFFVSFFEVIALFSKPLLKKGLSFLFMGIATTSIMQLHLSWPLLVPFIIYAFCTNLKPSLSKLFKYLLYFLSGIIVGALTLFPTLLKFGLHGGGDAQSNIVFTPDNYKNLFIVLTRYLSFAAYEIPYMLNGGNMTGWTDFIKAVKWESPFVIFLLIFGLAQVGFFILSFFLKNENEGWNKIKWLNVFTWLWIFFVFFFSIEGPSSHAFYIMLPLPFLYSFYCYQPLLKKKKIWITLLKTAAICGLFFHFGLAIYNYPLNSLYKNRALVQSAIDKKDYTIFGYRRPVKNGQGY